MYSTDVDHVKIYQNIPIQNFVMLKPFIGAFCNQFYVISPECIMEDCVRSAVIDYTILEIKNLHVFLTRERYLGSVIVLQSWHKTDECVSSRFAVLFV